MAPSTTTCVLRKFVKVVFHLLTQGYCRASCLNNQDPLGACFAHTGSVSASLPLLRLLHAGEGIASVLIEDLERQWNSFLNILP